MSDAEAEVTIGATIDDAVAAIEKLSASFEDFAKHTTESLGSVSESLKEVGETVKKTLEVFLSVEGIKHAIEQTREFARESEQMAARLGGGVSAASEFIVAMDDIGVSAETAGGVMQRLQRQMKSNEGGLNELGVKTRDIRTGQFLPLNEILTNSIETLKTFKEGTDRNGAAMVIFGGRVGDLSRLMKYNAEVQKEAEEKARSLGLTMTKESAEGAENFRKTLNDLGDVMKGLYKVIGDSVMPVLSSMGNYLAENGPGAVAVFGAAFKSLVQVFDTAWLVVQQFLELVRLAIQSLTIFALSVKDAIANAFSPTVAVAKFKEGMKQIEDVYKETNERLIANQEAYLKRTSERWNEGKRAGAGEGGRGGPDPKAKELQAAEYDEQRKAAERGLALEEEFLKQEVQAHRLTEEYKAIIMREANENAYAYEREILEKKAALYASDKVKHAQVLAEIAELDGKYRLDRLKGEGDEAKAIQQEQEKDAERRRQIAEAVTKMLEKEIKERAALESSAINARLALADTGAKREVAYLDQLVQTGEINAQRKLEIERELLGNVYEAKRQELLKERDIAQASEEDTVKQHQETDQKLAALDAQHLLDLQTNTNAVLKAVGERWKQLFDAITGAFSTTIKGIILGTTTWRDGMRNIFSSVLGEFISLGVKMVSEWAMMELKKTYATVIGTAERTAAEAAGAEATSAATLPSIIKTILNFAQQTFAGVWAALSGIPYVGPALAAAAAPAAAATVVGAASLLSASGGFDVPSGLNPVTQLHQEEMVLPADIANDVRRMAGGGKGGGGSVIQVKAMDSQDVMRALRKGGALDKTLRRLNRSHGNVTGRG